MAEYFNVTTNLGDAEIANAIATNTKIDITHIAFGDGNGSVPTPSKSRTALVREVHRQAVTKYERHATNTNWIVIETIIPSDIGGFTIREMGIIGNGKLISHGSHAPFEKVADPSGVSEYRLKFTQNITDGNVVSITLDDSLIYATQAWVEENFIKRNEIIDNLTTDNATKPVSAKQAKKLQDEKVNKTDVLTFEQGGTSVDNLEDAARIVGAPIGSILPFAGSIAPDGWMFARGGSFSASIYPLLAKVIPSLVIPDTRGVTLRGLDSGRGFDSSRELLTYQEDELKSHNHSFILRAYSVESPGVEAAYDYLRYIRADGSGPLFKEWNANATVPLTIYATGGSETRMKNLAVNYIIRGA